MVEVYLYDGNMVSTYEKVVKTILSYFNKRSYSYSATFHKPDINFLKCLEFIINNVDVSLNEITFTFENIELSSFIAKDKDYKKYTWTIIKVLR